LNLESQLLFFFSALGAFNGLFLSLYFAFFTKSKSKALYFLSALLFVISLRVGKSVFFFFYPGTSSLFIQIGLTACFLIGPFLYLYTNKTLHPDRLTRNHWLWHIIPVIVLMAIVGYLYPYRENWKLWRLRSGGILAIILLVQWSTYMFVTLFLSRNLILKLFSKQEKLSSQSVWLLNVVFGNLIIWLAYRISSYTSYIVGAISFSFTLYLSIVLWLFRKNKASIFEQKVKYSNKKLKDAEATQIEEGLNKMMLQESYKNPKLKLSDLAKELDVSSHSLSQYLNDNLQKNFAKYINEYRVKDAEEMLKKNKVLTIEAIGNECGFKSNSSFYAAFKAVNGMTPAQFKKSNS